MHEVKSLYLLPQLCCEHKTALKNKALKKKRSSWVIGKKQERKKLHGCLIKQN